MEGLSNLDEDIMLQIQDNMFTFENLVDVVTGRFRQSCGMLIKISDDGIERRSEFVKEKFSTNVFTRPSDVYR